MIGQSVGPPLALPPPLFLQFRRGTGRALARPGVGPLRALFFYSLYLSCGSAGSCVSGSSVGDAKSCWGNAATCSVRVGGPISECVVQLGDAPRAGGAAG
jgi:hypothetical protein